MGPTPNRQEHPKQKPHARRRPASGQTPNQPRDRMDGKRHCAHQGPDRATNAPSDPWISYRRWWMLVGLVQLVHPRRRVGRSPTAARDARQFLAKLARLRWSRRLRGRRVVPLRQSPIASQPTRRSRSDFGVSNPFAQARSAWAKAAAPLPGGTSNASRPSPNCKSTGQRSLG